MLDRSDELMEPVKHQKGPVSNKPFEPAFDSQVKLVKRGKRIMVDFDGPIHDYDDGFQGGRIYGSEVIGALKAVQRLHDQGYDVWIFTTRGGDPVLKKGVEEWVRHKQLVDGWTFPIQVTHEKLPAIAYIDDRAIRFTNWADMRKYFD